MSPPKKCVKCREPILWEMLCGVRIFVEVGRRKVYATRCGCGDVKRDSAGRRIRGET